MSHVEEGRPKTLAVSWMAAVSVQRFWRGLKGRKLGQVSKGISCSYGFRCIHHFTYSVLGSSIRNAYGNKMLDTFFHKFGNDFATFFRQDVKKLFVFGAEKAR